MKTVVIRKGQVRKLKNGQEVYDVSVRIPIEHLQLLGWTYGDILTMTADKRTGRLIAEKSNTN